MLRKIEAVIKKAVGGKVQVFVTTSEKPEFGDYSTNIAFSLAKEKTFREFSPYILYMIFINN